MQWLRENRGFGVSEVARAIRMTSATYSKIERDQREASFIMMYRLCAFYEISMHEFADMLSSAELGRSDLSTIRVLRKRQEKSS